MNITNLSKAKLEQVSNDCGSTVSAATVGQYLANPAYDINGVAAALSTSPQWLQKALDKPEPSVPVITSTNI